MEDVWCFLWERSGLTWGVKLVQFLDCYFHGGYHPNRAEQASGFSEASGGLLIANGNVFQRSGSVSSPKSIPEANSLFVMFQQFFCCSYSVINHLAGSEHTGQRRQLTLWHAAITLHLVKRQSHSYWQMRAAKKRKTATQYRTND